MKSSTLVSVLARTTTAMAVVAPLIVFGFVYVLLVQPQREAAEVAQRSLETLRAQLDHQRMFDRRAVVTPIAALRQFEARTADSDPAAAVVKALTALLDNPAVGGVSNVAIETGAPASAPGDSRLAVFGGQLAYTPITVVFDARFEQIGRVFWNLRTLPTTFELRSIEMTAAPSSAMRVRLVVFAYQRGALRPQRPAPGVEQPRLLVRAAGRPRTARRGETVVPPEAEPTVSTILFSSGRRIALVDGRIVRVGDRIGTGLVTAIEPNAVVITREGRGELRLELERPIIGMARR